MRATEPRLEPPDRDEDIYNLDAADVLQALPDKVQDDLWADFRESTAGEKAFLDYIDDSDVREKFRDEIRRSIGAA